MDWLEIIAVYRYATLSFSRIAAQRTSVCVCVCDWCVCVAHTVKNFRVIAASVSLQGVEGSVAVFSGWRQKFQRFVTFSAMIRRNDWWGWIFAEWLTQSWADKYSIVCLSNLNCWPLLSWEVSNFSIPVWFGDLLSVCEPSQCGSRFCLPLIAWKLFCFLRPRHQLMCCTSDAVVELFYVLSLMPLMRVAAFIELE